MEPAYCPVKSILKYILHVNPQCLAVLECTNAQFFRQHLLKYRNDSIEHPERLFTFGSSREGIY